jgi:hypothetical protein
MTTAWKTHLFFAVTWLCLYEICRRKGYTDPSSYFFDEERAYLPAYSALREQQADTFITRIEHGKSQAERTLDNKNRPLCIGIPSVKRLDEQFLRRTIASLVDHLDTDHREQFWLVVLLADKEADLNPAYGQAWLQALADEVLYYDAQKTTPEGSRYRQVPWNIDGRDRGEERNENVRLDYATLITACQEKHAEYFVLIEDDIIASTGWFSRLRRGLRQADMAGMAPDWLYLRLFYAETYLGWNSEELPIYVRNVVLVYIGVAVLASVKVSGGQGARPTLSRRHRRVTAVSVLWTTPFVLLYFMAGRLLVNPYGSGLQEMPDYGCCAQGLAFPSRHLAVLKNRLTSPPFDLAGDSLVESVADGMNFKKLALVPSLLQHVGVRGTSAPGGAPKQTWNFGFEKQNG